MGSARGIQKPSERVTRVLLHSLSGTVSKAWWRCLPGCCHRPLLTCEVEPLSAEQRCCRCDTHIQKMKGKCFGFFFLLFLE